MSEAPAISPTRRRFLRQFELVERVRSYDAKVDEGLLNRAYVYATRAHGAQKRHSGDPYFAHPIEVAGILTEYKLDAATIAAGLLHDTVEDTLADEADIRAKFGDEVALLVDGVTKLSRLEMQPEQNKQAANLQKFILAMARDVRVLLIKLADRLHNMRTLQFVPNAEKRRRVALETLEIYAPLARRIGVERMAQELEALAFHEAFPEPEAMIELRLSHLRQEKGANVLVAQQRLQSLCDEALLPARVYGRQKTPFSIWRKLERKQVQFNDLADIYAFRVIVPHEHDCYRALGLIHREWRCVPELFEDYISNPKPNGYRSIHTTVVGPGNVRIEIQIRTEEMDRNAEVGVAAHWRYKNESYGYDEAGAVSAGLDARELTRSLLEIAEHGGDADEFLEHAKLEMYQDHVFAFTPKGALIALPLGATPLDFAYAVHSDLGDRCEGAIINGEAQPLRTPLRNGDVVEILRGAHAAPAQDWEALTKTGRAKSHQRRLERLLRREEFLRMGRDLVAHALHRYGYELRETLLAEAAVRLGKRDDDDIFVSVGEGTLDANQVAVAAFPHLEERVRRDQERKPMDRSKATLYVTGANLTKGVSLHFARCCTPIPGDRIVGVPEPGRGMTIHVMDCRRLEAHEGGQAAWVRFLWSPAADETLGVAKITTTVENSRGVLADLCRIIADSDGNILNVRMTQRSADFFDMVFDVEVADVRQLTEIVMAMRAHRAVKTAERNQG